MIRLEHKNAVYSFERSSEGEGRWICIKGKVLGSLSKSTAHLFVPIQVNSLLTKLAVSQGLGEAKDFSRWIMEEKKKRVVTVGTKAKPNRRSGVIGGFNLSSFFFDKGAEEKNVDELDLDEMEVEDIDSEGEVWEGGAFE